VRVVRLANYVAPASGGLRTSLRELGAGYLAAGHEPVLVIPGARPGRQLTEQGLVVTVPGWRVPATGGYRAILARRSLRRLLEQLEPRGGGGRVPDQGADRAAGPDERGGDSAALTPGRAEDQDRQPGGVWRGHRRDVRAAQLRSTEG
jgi:hypothetical protein